MRKGHSVSNIVCLRFGACHVLVYQHQLAPYPLHHERVPGGCTDESGTYNADFHPIPFQGRSEDERQILMARTQTQPVQRLTGSLQHGTLGVDHRHQFVPGFHE